MNYKSDSRMHSFTMQFFTINLVRDLFAIKQRLKLMVVNFLPESLMYLFIHKI